LEDLSLSICILVKNEAAALPYALESIIDIASEIIVLDTGSTDNSPEIARSFGAKVYQYQWQDDFSAARNQAVKYTTGEWVLFFDADNVFPEESKKLLPKLLENNDVDLYYLKWTEGDIAPDKTDDRLLPAHFEIQINQDIIEELSYQYLMPYLFRNSNSIKFSGRVFEAFENIDIRSEISNINIYHYFYNKESQKIKTERKKHLLTLSLEKCNLTINEKLLLKAKLLIQEIFSARLFFKQLRLKETVISSGNTVNKADEVFFNHAKKWYRDNNFQLKDKILELNNNLELYINEIVIADFEQWYSESLYFLINEAEGPQIYAGLLQKIRNFYPLSLNLKFNNYLLFYKNGNFAECSKILDNIIALLKEKKINLKPGITIRSRYLNLDYLYYLKSVNSFQNGDSSNYEYYKELIKKPDKYFKKFESLKKSGKNLESFSKDSASNILKDLPKKICNKFNLVSVNIFQDFMVNRAVFHDNIQLLAHSFADLGIEYIISDNKLQKEYNNILFQSFSTSEFNDYARNYTYIPYQMEPLFIAPYEEYIKVDRYSNYLKLLENATSIWDYLEQNINYLNSININNASLLPFGFHEKMHVLDFNKEKTIDILIYGALYNRRIEIYNKLVARGFKVKFMTNMYGKERNEIIEKAKIILNINFSEKLSSEHRLSFLLNNACFIISEKPPDDYFNEFEDCLVLAPFEKIIETCEFYLRPENDMLRQEIAEKGFSTFSKNKMVNNLRKLIESSRYKNII
jgi:glycosyltransferase involved in cell wall biosynthesis